MIVKSMRQEWQEVLELYYEATDEPNYYRCQECSAKVYAGSSEYSDFMIHELREHPKRG